jgi:flagellar capping protein FliD
VTAGTFTINGVQFTVNPATQSLNDVINEVNASNAGVVLQYNSATSSVSITNKTPGPQSVLLGAAGDTSNFLAAAGLTDQQDTLTAAAGAGTSALTVANGAEFAAGQSIVIGGGTANQETATILSVVGNTVNLTAPLVNNHNSGEYVGWAPTTTTGTQASVTYTNSSGAEQTVYSSTDSFTNVIPGFTLNVTSSGGAAGSTFYTVNVASDPSQAETAINKFITAYNQAITEINNDTVAPTVSASTGTNGTAQSTSSGGGVLYGNFDIENLKTNLVNLVSGFIPSGSTSYNSLASVGLLLSTQSEVLGGVKDVDADTGQPIDSTDTDDSKNTYTSANGLLAALDTTTFEAAYAANTSAVSSLFTLIPPTISSGGNTTYNNDGNQGFAYLIGNYLANVNGITTFLQDNSITPGDLNSVLLTVVLDQNNQQIDSLNQQIDTITSEANNQANSLRSEFSSSESQIAELQVLQEEIGAIGH